MEYQNFLVQVKEALEQAVPEAQVDLHHVLKNNQVALDGVTILREGELISPTVYLNEYFYLYQDGMELADIVKAVLEQYDAGICKPAFEVTELKHFEYVKDHIVFKLINYEKNREMLADMPHRRVLDEPSDSEDALSFPSSDAYLPCRSR